MLSKQDGAYRNLASDERAGLVEMSRRLSLATLPTNNSDATKALCLRAFICDAVFADKGQPAMAKENYGAIIRALHREDCELRSPIDRKNTSLYSTTKDESRKPTPSSKT